MAQSAWITHVKKYAKTHKIEYGDALKKASASYNGAPKTMKRKSMKGGKKSKNSKTARRR